MKDEFKQFLVEDIGISEELIVKMTAEEPLEEDYDFDLVKNHWKSTNKDNVLATFGDDYAKAKMEKQFGIFKGSRNQARNKALDLGLTRKEAESKTPEEMDALVAEKMKERIEAASISTDDELKKNLQDSLTAANEYKGKYEELSAKMEEEINKVRTEAQQLVFEKDLDQVLEYELSKLDWGIPEIQRKEWKGILKRKVREDYKVDLDGTLKSLNGEQAMNYERNGGYSKVSEPLTYLFNQHKLGAKSNGGVGSDDVPAGPVIGGGITSDKMSPEVKAMLERAQKATRR